MSKMQVVTLRMTEEEIAKLDELAKGYYYYKRSDIIRAACQFLTQACSKGGQAQIIAGYGRQWKDYVFILEREDRVNGAQRYKK